jgi:carbamoyl-phosphate synthase large subunit
MPVLAGIARDVLLDAKNLGFSDVQIGNIIRADPSQVRRERIALGVVPCVKQIDTLGAEYPAKTNYLYMTYGGMTHDVTSSEDAVLFLGSGAYRIGSSVEFDWCCVNAATTAKALGNMTIMLNNNPETVSTDYDVCDRLYFEEISLERVLDIVDFERPRGTIISMGGQLPNNLALPLSKEGVVLLGTSAQSIDMAENRHVFSQLLDRLDIEQPPWKELTSISEAKAFANTVAYPVLIRPSYVLSGAAMNVVWDDESLLRFLKEASEVNPAHPVVISKFIENSKEVEIDAVAKDGIILIYAISEHVENAGIHSGDATIVLPAQRLYIETIRKVKGVARGIALALNITGPFNIQFLAKNNKLSVIECNLRASRSFPFCSKIFKQNLIEYATRAMLGAPVQKVEKSLLDLDYVGVKAAQFSFSRLKGSDPMLGVEMASTGEVGCLGHDLEEAFMKAFLSVGFKVPKRKILLSTGPLDSKVKFLESAMMLKEMGYALCATPGTATFFQEHGIDVEMVHWPNSGKRPNVKEYLMNGDIDFVINIPKNNMKDELKNDYEIRRIAVDFDISLVTNLQVAIQIVEGLLFMKNNPLEILSWDEY